MIETSLYNILGVSPKATQKEIKNAFKKKAYELHPDKNQGDKTSVSRFQEVREAYNILRNEQKREKYDRYGLSSFSEEPIETQNFFSRLFGSFGEPKMDIPTFNKKGRKTKDYYFTVNVSLKELYNGCIKKVTIPLQRFCNKCNGHGTYDGSPAPLCHDCRGTGRKTTIYRRGSTVYQDESICSRCQGTGYFISDHQRCRRCRGSKTLKENITYEIEIERGMEDGDTIIICGESNDEPGYERGDIEIVLSELKDERFTRYSENLLYKKTLSLTESLAGYSFMLKTLDDRYLHIYSDSPVSNGDVICIKNEGMPLSNMSLSKGDLFIQFSVKIPDAIHEEVKKALRKYMPANDTENVDDEDNIFTPKVFKSTMFEFKKSPSAKSKKKESISISVTETTKTFINHDDEKAKQQPNGCQPM